VSRYFFLTLYIGTPNQRDHGIGIFLGSLFCRVLFLLSKGAKAVGKEVVRTGMNVACDVIQRDTPFKEAFNIRIKHSAANLKRKAEEKKLIFLWKDQDIQS